ncbi:hypothetical protein FIA58_005800 [Flavobacterium jejuense]|uniref:Uncharacterized protein n=1 Tax=Flavobacterium jejuense TaxID=1544455 RepID=A0ABX0INM4_9FLAO|nr:hypothetical protein [Flavobacterium jejuense]NHN25188.1 hypothetical protein [Flavobacterium jejuense]
MIKSFEKDIILHFLGKQPSKKIIPVLNKKKIYNIRGKSYSPKSIQDIINGKTENRIVEIQIIKIIEKEKRINSKIEDLKNEIFGTR